MRHPFVRTRPLLVAALLLATVACDKGSTGSDPDPNPLPLKIHFEDGFGGSSLANYSAFDQSTGFGDPMSVWSESGGELIGQGTASQNVLIRHDISLQDGYIEADIDIADDAGLVFRYLDENNYYLLTVRDDEASLPQFRTDNLELYLAYHGNFYALALGDFDLPRTRHRIRVEFVGPQYRVFVDNALVGTLNYNYLTAAGGVGVRHMKHPDAVSSRNVYDRVAGGEL